MEPEVHRYGLTIKFVRVASVILFLLLVVDGSLRLLIALLGMMKYSEFGMKVVSAVLGSFFLILIQALLFFQFSYHLYSDIELDGNGLKIKYIFRSRTIPWQDILDIEKVYYFGFIRARRWKVIVCTTGLPFIFRLFGLIYTGSIMPVIPVSPSISEYQRLIERISLQVKREDRRSALRKRNP